MQRKIRRSVLEVPTMDPHKWDKIPSIPADVFFIDMEDSVPTQLKEQARDKVAASIKDPSHFGGREVFCRVNNLSTPWGREDLMAMAEARAPVIVYPKAVSAAELREALEILTKHAEAPEVFALIETPQAVLRLNEIAATPGVTGLFFGQGDLAMATGISLLNGRHLFAEGFRYARTKMIMAARAYDLNAMEAIFVGDLRDLEAVKEAVMQSKLFGYTTLLTFYPPHIPIINEALTPTTQELKWHARVVEAYEEAVGSGLASVTLDGTWLTIHQYTEAQQALEMARDLGLS